ncbi:hypothetical protein MHYP_G00256730 [Metynnis hypsauchen]
MAASHQSMEEDKKVLQELSVQEVQLKDTDEQSLKVRSYVSGSHRTKGSRASQISMAAAQARADAEAAKARAAYSRKEKELKIEKARLEAELDALRQDRDADAANAKALVMEAAAAEGSYRSSLASLESLPKEQNVREKVSEYVANHTYIEHSHYEEELDLTPQTPQLPAQPTHIQEHNTSTPAQPSALPDNGMQQRFSPQQPHMQSPVSQWVDREQRMSQVHCDEDASLLQDDAYMCSVFHHLLFGWNSDLSGNCTKSTGRYSFGGNLPERNIALWISNVTQSDAGLYFCRIELDETVNWFTSQGITLNVKEPQKLQRLYIQTTVTGERWVTCEISGKPLPTVKWTQPENITTSPIFFQTGLLASYSLPASPNTNYTCQIDGEDGVPTGGAKGIRES